MLLYNIIMKYVITIISMLAFNMGAQACSYLRPSPKDAYEYLSVIFEGTLWAVYIDGEQIPLSTLENYKIDRSQNHEIKIKIKPTRFYHGEESKFITLINNVNYQTSCNNEIYLPNRLANTTWGGFLGDDGLYHTGSYAAISAFVAVDMKKRIDKYEKLLKDLSSFSSTAISNLINIEIQAAKSILLSENNIIKRNFNRTQKELNMLPVDILEMRHTLMNALHFPREALKTQTALANKTTSRKNGKF